MKSCKGCPITSGLSYQKRLIQLLGQSVRVITPTSTITGVVHEVTPTFFRAGLTRIALSAPVAIDVGFFEAACSFKKLSDQVPVMVRVHRIGTLNGCLVTLSKEFVEFEQNLPEDLARWIVPLVRGISVRCEEDNEE